MCQSIHLKQMLSQKSQYFALLVMNRLQCVIQTIKQLNTPKLQANLAHLWLTLAQLSPQL